jgi:HTH-type transcriptional regulator, transcriptional repressor of NAD biosynthesis genes
MEEKLRQIDCSCLKVVLYGPESTGKTTLGKALASYYNCSYVPEFSRIYAEEKLRLGFELTKSDVMPIAIGQMKHENQIAINSDKIIICDTNLLETKIYSQYIYDGFCPNELNLAVAKANYDLYILTDIDVPWEYDKVRSSEIERNKMFNLFKKNLLALDVPYIIVSGNKEIRFLKAIEKINKLLV